MWGAIAAGTVAYVSTDHAPWPRPRKQYAGDIFAVGAGLTGMQSVAPLMYTLLAERGLPVTLMAWLCSEAPARYHGLDPAKGGLRIGADADVCVLERGGFVFDERDIRDREEARWSPWHGRAMQARVAATWLRGRLVWDGASVLARPGEGRFVPRQHRDSGLRAAR
jgi:allantoinase